MKRAILPMTVLIFSILTLTYVLYPLPFMHGIDKINHATGWTIPIPPHPQYPFGLPEPEPTTAPEAGKTCATFPVPLGEAAPTKAALDCLTVTTNRPALADPNYVRADYGKGWVDVDGNGCTTRVDVLYQWLDKTQPFDVRPSGKCATNVYAGTWHDPYTGKTITLTDAKDPAQAQTLQIDHLVPLSEASKSGANLWAPERKAAFANDPLNLTPVDGPTNNSKGDKDPAAWKPRKDYQCDYATRYIAVKAKWDLTVDAPEKAALTDMLTYCAG